MQTNMPLFFQKAGGLGEALSLYPIHNDNECLESASGYEF
jgi:hypothetical protein